MADDTPKKQELLEWMESRSLSIDDIAFFCEYTADYMNFLTGHTLKTNNVHQGADQAGNPGRSVAGLMFGNTRYRSILTKMDEGQKFSGGSNVGISMYATDLVAKPRFALDIERESSLHTIAVRFAFTPLENWEYSFQDYSAPVGAREASRKATADMVMEHLEECVEESLKTQKMNLILPYDKAIEVMIDSYLALFEKVVEKLAFDLPKSFELQKAVRDFGNAILLRIKPDTKDALEYFIQQRSKEPIKAEDLNYDNCKRIYIDVLASNGMDKNTAMIAAQQFESKFAEKLQALGIGGNAAILH